MRAFAWNLVLAVGWCAITGEINAFNFAAGFLIGYLALYPPPGDVGTRYFRKMRQLIGFAAFFAAEILLAALRIAYDVLTPTHHMKPAVLAVPLDAETDAEITLLANLISLTPGSLSLDVSPDRSTLYVHVMYMDDPKDTIARIKSGFERRVVELLR